MNSKPGKGRKIAGWCAVIISSLFTSFWAFWGIVENFHEGWYHKSFADNFIMMLAQYLLIPLLFMLLSLISLRFQKPGGIAHLIIGIAIYLFLIKMPAALMYVTLPFAILGALYYFAELPNKKISLALLIGIPFLIILGFGTFNGIRVAGRFDDGNLETRTIKGNGVELVWAPAGPGWPEKGTSWQEAKDICARLNADGKTLSDTPVNIWRLPTLDEAVRSMVHHGNNAGGIFNPQTKKGEYKETPDKESPLWNKYSKVIYWWTSDEADNKQAFIVVYDGGVWPRLKTIRADYMAYRAVKNPN